jgi:hypothetical protein
MSVRSLQPGEHVLCANRERHVEPLLAVLSAARYESRSSIASTLVSEEEASPAHHNQRRACGGDAQGGGAPGPLVRCVGHYSQVDSNDGRQRDGHLRRAWQPGGRNIIDVAFSAGPICLFGREYAVRQWRIRSPAAPRLPRSAARGASTSSIASILASAAEALLAHHNQL